MAFERFGYFASDLSRLTDELDREAVHKQLSKAPAIPDDYRRVWAYVLEMHYTDCPLYSVLSHRSNNPPPVKDPAEEPWYIKLAGKVVIGVIIVLLSSLIISLF